MSLARAEIWADLHTHSTASDGTLTPAELVRAASRVGLKALGLTDHDTLDGLTEAEEAARDVGLELVPGVEINTDALGDEVHILGYYIDRTDSGLAELLRRLRQGRISRGEEMVRRLRAIGYQISWERVGELARGGVVGRPHVARALVEAGRVPSVKAAFAQLLSPGCPGYVPRLKLDPFQAVIEIRRAGGIAVLAHPGQLGQRGEPLVRRLLAGGLQGIEVYHPDHDPPDSARLKDLAGRLGLLITGGSDYHGSGTIELGFWGANRAAFEALKITALKQTGISPASWSNNNSDSS